LSQLDALLRDFAEFFRHTPEIDDIDRKKRRGFLELVVDCRESLMRHRSRPSMPMSMSKRSGADPVAREPNRNMR
jgi:hypothetical protein